MEEGLVFYRNRIGMSFPWKECGLVVLNCFQNHFYEENKHAILKSNIFPLHAPVILLVKFANSFEHLINDHTAFALWPSKYQNQRCSSRDVF